MRGRVQYRLKIILYVPSVLYMGALLCGMIWLVVRVIWHIVYRHHQHKTTTHSIKRKEEGNLMMMKYFYFYYFFFVSKHLSYIHYVVLFQNRYYKNFSPPTHCFPKNQPYLDICLIKFSTFFTNEKHYMWHTLYILWLCIFNEYFFFLIGQKNFLFTYFSQPICLFETKCKKKFNFR